MQKIDKTNALPPKSLTRLNQYKGVSWGDIPEAVKSPIRAHLLAEQKGLCCYCCQNIEDKTTHIEHLKCRQNYPKLSFNYDNLLLSCNNRKQCDNAKGNQELPLTPLMVECDKEIKLNLVGELVANTDRGEQSLNILNLNSRKLCMLRKLLVDVIILDLDTSHPEQPPYEIRDKDKIKKILQSMQNTPQYEELRYIVNKLT